MLRSLLVSICLVLIAFSTAAQPEDSTRVYYAITPDSEIYAYALNADNTFSELGIIGEIGEPWIGMRDHFRVSADTVLAYIATDTRGDFYALRPDGVTVLNIPNGLVDASLTDRFEVVAYRYPYLAIVPILTIDNDYNQQSISTTDADGNAEVFVVDNNDVSNAVVINVETLQTTILPRTLDPFNANYAVRFAEDAPLVRYAYRENVNGGYSEMDGYAVDGIAEYNLETDTETLIYEAELSVEFGFIMGNTDGSQWTHDFDYEAPAISIDLDGTASEIDVNAFHPDDPIFSAMYSDNVVVFSTRCREDCLFTLRGPDNAEPIGLPLPDLGDDNFVADVWPTGDGHYVALTSGEFYDYVLAFFRTSPEGPADYIGMMPIDLVQEGDSFSQNGRYALLYDTPDSDTLRFVDTYNNTDLYTIEGMDDRNYSWVSFENGFTFTALSSPNVNTVIYHYASGELATWDSGMEVVDILPEGGYVVQTLDGLIAYDMSGETISNVTTAGQVFAAREPQTYLFYVEE